MDIEFEQLHSVITSNQITGDEDGETILNSIKNLLNIAISDLLDIESSDSEDSRTSHEFAPVQDADASHQCSSSSVQPTAGAGTLRARRGSSQHGTSSSGGGDAEHASVKAASPKPYHGSNSSPGDGKSSHAPSVMELASAHQSPRDSKPKGLLDVVVHGFSTFGRKATYLLNTLDEEFDQIFNPENEDVDNNGEAKEHLHPTTAVEDTTQLSADAQQQHDPSASTTGTGLDAEQTALNSSCSDLPQASSDAPVKVAKRTTKAQRGRTAKEVPDAAAQHPAGPSSRSSGTKACGPDNPRAAALDIPEGHSILGAMIQALGKDMGTGSTTSIQGPAVCQVIKAAPLPGPDCNDPKVLRQALQQLQSAYQEALQRLEATSQQYAELCGEHGRRHGSGSDPLDDAVRQQLEALLLEKARLAEENNRLARENQALHQLLAYTTEHSECITEEYVCYDMEGFSCPVRSPVAYCDDDVAAVDSYYSNFLPSSQLPDIATLFSLPADDSLATGMSQEEPQTVEPAGQADSSSFSWAEWDEVEAASGHDDASVQQSTESVGTAGEEEEGGGQGLPADPGQAAACLQQPFAGLDTMGEEAVCADQGVREEAMCTDQGLLAPLEDVSRCDKDEVGSQESDDMRVVEDTPAAPLPCSPGVKEVVALGIVQSSVLAVGDGFDAHVMVSTLSASGSELSAQ